MKLGRALVIAFTVTGLGCLLFLFSIQKMWEVPPLPVSRVSAVPPRIETLELKILKKHWMRPNWRTEQGYLVTIHEIAPDEFICPVHQLPLRNEPVPVVGGLIRPTISDILDFFPYGRLCAYSGSCVLGGEVNVFRCEACIEIAKEWHGCDTWEFEVKGIPIPRSKR